MRSAVCVVGLGAGAMSSLIASILLADFDGHMGWDGGWGVLMVIGMLLFWALIIAGVVWLVREMVGQRDRHARADDPLETLDRRLADGSISAEDYQQRRAILTGRDGNAEPG